MRMWISPFLTVLIVLFVHVDGRNRVLLPSDGGQADVSFLVDEFPIIKEVTGYISTQDEVPSSLDPPPPSFICDTCLEISKKAERILSDPNLSENIGTFSAEFCHILPPDVQAKCLKTSKKCINETISFLENMFHKENLCYSTGLCAGNSQKSHYYLPGLSKPQSLRVPDFSLNGFAPKLSDDKSCTTCRNATDAILNALEDPSTKIKIIKFLLKTCKEVEDRVPQCKKMVFEYAPIVLARLEKYLKNNDLCNLLQLCKDAAPQLLMKS